MNFEIEKNQKNILIGITIIVMLIVVIVVIVVIVTRKKPQPPPIPRKWSLEPTQSTQSDDEPLPFKVGDTVTYEFQISTEAVDLCAPGSGTAIAFGTVGNVDIDTGAIGVRWTHIYNSGHKKEIPGPNCCWTRTKPKIGDTSNEWDLKYWGDENKNPTYLKGYGLITQFLVPTLTPGLKKAVSNPISDCSQAL
jgi:hypothetical protein